MRGNVLSVREKEFVQAAIAQGASNRRLVFSEILPNVISVVIVLLPLMIATTILTEAALSFLGVGVQPPGASWGTIIGDGQQLLYTRPWVAIAPGIMIVLTVLSLNVLGDGIRDALDPRAKLGYRGEGRCWRFIVRRLIGTVRVMFAITVLVFLIFFATPGVDPARQLAGRNPNPETIAADPPPVRPRQAAAGSVPDDDEEALHQPRPGLLLEPGAEGGAADRRRRCR